MTEQVTNGAPRVPEAIYFRYFGGNEVRLTDHSFNLEACVIWGTGFILGEYFGLAASGNSFVAVFTRPDQNGIQSIFARRVGL